MTNNANAIVARSTATKGDDDDDGAGAGSRIDDDNDFVWLCVNVTQAEASDWLALKCETQSVCAACLLSPTTIPTDPGAGQYRTRLTTTSGTRRAGDLSSARTRPRVS